ncbi:hypothetical protein B0H14DRAFT_2651835 [Mycena olivaceomarginata]|nr:hypothetical protein B0H14DRAFT_2651835 [Mycena olivaceomarginata]
MSLSQLSWATLVPLSNRDPVLPPIEKLSSHPEVPADTTGTINLWWQDHSQEAFEATLRNSVNCVVPKIEKEIWERGLLLFKSGDYLVRNKLRGDDFMEDRNRVFGDTSNFVSFPAAEDNISSLHNVPKKKCKSTAHQKGLLFEQSPQIFSLGNAPQCYSLSVTVQGQKALHAPALGNKIVDGIELDDDLALQRDLMEEGMEWNESQRPESEVQNIRDQRLEDRGRRIKLEIQRTEAIRSNQKEARQLNHKVVEQSNQKKGGWTVKPEEGWTVGPEGQRQEDLGPNEEVRAGGAGTGGRRYPERNPEGHRQEDDQRMTTGGKATMNKRKKLKPEEKDQRDLIGEGIKPWK